MIKKHYANILEPMIMSSIMCFFMFLIMTWVHLGFSDNYILDCSKAFLHGLIVVIPVGIFIGPLVRRLTNRITAKIKSN